MSGYGQDQGYGQQQQGYAQQQGQQGQFSEQSSFSEQSTYTDTKQFAQGQQGQQYGQQAQQYGDQAQAQGAGGAAQHQPHGFMENVKDKMEHTSKTKMALGALGAAALIGGAVAGGVAIKHHIDEKKHEEQQRQDQSQQAQSQSYSSTTTTTTTTTMQVLGNQGDNKIRYGSKVALKHNMTGRFLRFSFNNPKGNSNQNVVVAGGWILGEDEYWQVVPGSNGGNASNVISYGSTVRFRHIKTGHMLHSHNFKSLVTGQQEVSGFSSTDDNDDWIVERWEGGQGDWVAEEGFRLVHSKTRVYLHSHDKTLPGVESCEVTGFSGDEHDENSRWRVCW